MTVSLRQVNSNALPRTFMIELVSHSSIWMSPGDLPIAEGHRARGVSPSAVRWDGHFASAHRKKSSRCQILPGVPYLVATSTERIAMRTCIRRSLISAVLIATATTASARAADVAWIGAGTTSNWTNANNWWGFNRPNNDGADTVEMYGDYGHDANVVNQDYWIALLKFGIDSNDEQSWTINQSNSAVLSINQGIGNSTSKTQTVNVPIRLTDDIFIGNNGDGTKNYGTMNIGNVNLNGHDLELYPSSNGINMTGTISGSGHVWMQHTGTATLSGSNTWSGRLYIRKGSVVANFGASLGSTSNRIVFNQIDANSIPTLVRGNSGSISIPISFDAGEGRIETPAGTTLTLTSGLDGTPNGSFAKTGAGTVVLSATRVKYDSTIVRAGTLRLAATDAASTNGMQVLNGATLIVDSNITQNVRSLDGFGQIQMGAGSSLFVGTSDSPPPTNNGTGTFGGIISGTNALVVKQGSGVFSLTGPGTYAGITDVRGGTLVVNNLTAGSSATGTSTVSVKAGTRLAGDGAISGWVYIDGGGRIAPSNANQIDAGIGSLSIGNLVLLGNAITDIDFSSTSIDRIDVTGSATLDGVLELNHSGTSLPSIGVSRKLIAATGSTLNVFSSIVGVQRDATTSIAITYTAQDVFATAAGPADINLDLSTNFDDLLLLAANYNGSGVKTWSNGDLTGDGMTNFDDLLILAANYNSSSAVTGVGPGWSLAQASVPEPTALLSAFVGAATLLRRRRS
jgi:autotransporter-associated beta strand protein